MCIIKGLIMVKIVIVYFVWFTIFFEIDMNRIYIMIKEINYIRIIIILFMKYKVNYLILLYNISSCIIW